MSDDITALLHAADPPPMAVDPYAVLAGGQRRRRRRRVIGGSALTAAAVAVAVGLFGPGHDVALHPIPAHSPTPSPTTTTIDGTRLTVLSLPGGAGAALTYRIEGDTADAQWYANVYGSVLDAETPTFLFRTQLGGTDGAAQAVEGIGSDAGYLYVMTPAAPRRIAAYDAAGQPVSTGDVSTSAYLPALHMYATVLELDLLDDLSGQRAHQVTWTDQSGARAGLQVSDPASAPPVNAEELLIPPLPSDPWQLGTTVWVRQPSASVDRAQFWHDEGGLVGGPIELPIPRGADGVFTQVDGAGYAYAYGLVRSLPTSVTPVWRTTDRLPGESTFVTAQLSAHLWAVAIYRSGTSDDGTTNVTAVDWTDESGHSHHYDVP